MMLDGVLVLDLSRILAGPYCTQLLADLGARVLKLESPHGDDTRGWGPPFAAEESGYFLSVNRGKESVAVDLKHPEGARIVRDLAQRADVLVENFKGGDLRRYGLDYEALAPQRPGLVYASVTGFGRQGPRAGESGYDAALQALTGVMAMTGEEEGGPVKLGVAWVDVLTGVHAAVGILAALRERDRTGLGQHLDLSLFEVSLASLVNQAQGALLTGEAPRRMGTAHPSIVPYQAFDTADHPLMLAVGNDVQFRRLCVALGREGLADEARFATNQARVRHREELVPQLGAILQGRRRAEWLEVLRAARVPATPVNTVSEALADAQAEALGTVAAYQHPSAGRVPYVRSPLRHASRSSVGAEAPPPRLGEHTRAVLVELLQASDAQVQAWSDSGAVRVLAASS